MCDQTGSGPSRGSYRPTLPPQSPDTAQTFRNARLKDAREECEIGHDYTAMEPAGPPLSERLTLRNVEEAFRYQPWDVGQREAGEQVREVLTAAAKTILRVVPEGPLRTRALNDLIDARMKANAAITFRGRF